MTGRSSTLTLEPSAGISRQQLAGDLGTIGIQQGDQLAVGVSFKSLGRVEGGPETFIDALTDTVGPDGTVLMNTFTEFFNRTEVRAGWTDYVFDVDTTIANTGVVPEFFRRREGSFRSRHPTNSVAAIGKHADYLTRDHDEHAPAYLPFARLSELGGKYLAVGIGNKLPGFRHQAQYAAGLLAARGESRSSTFM